MNSCTCASQGTTLDFIQCAPCPPPMLNYSQFREHALSRQVCLTEICSIARRCRPEDPEVGADCFPVSSTTVYTTRNETAASSSHTTDYSIYTTNRSASTTGYTTELFTDQPPSETVRDSTFIIIIITVFAVSIVTVVAICVIRKRKRDEIKINDVDVYTTDDGTSTNPASSLCYKTTEDDNDKYCLKDETTGKTNPPDRDLLDGENVIQSTRKGGLYKTMNSCTCAPQGTTLDFIECAPCPPPMLNYSQFREHALSRQVCLTEICSIARRCGPEDPEVEADCFPVSSTTLYTTGYMTELFTDQPPSETVRDSTLVIIIIAFAVFLITVVAIVIWARKRCKIKDNGTAQTSENLKAIDEHPLHEALDVHTTDYGTSTNPASSLCNKTNEDDNDKYCLNDETTGKTNPPDTDQLDGENVIQSTKL